MGLPLRTVEISNAFGLGFVDYHPFYSSYKLRKKDSETRKTGKLYAFRKNFINTSFYAQNLFFLYIEYESGYKNLRIYRNAESIIT